MMLSAFMLPRRQRGFTLVEAIVVMVLTGILAGIMVLFIRRPMASYIDTAARADVADVAEIALRRMVRELHGALPNSIRFTVVNNVSLVEFIPTKAGGIYLSEEDGANASIHPPLRFSAGTNPNLFEVVGPLPVAPYAIAAGDSIVVYNLGSGITNADAYVGNNRALVSGVGLAAGGINAKTVVLGNNPFAAQNPTNRSPGNRFQVVSRPVTFACANNANGRGTLTRFWGYDFQSTQVNPATLTDPNLHSALMANNVVGCQFWVQQAANQNTALIGLSIALARPNPNTGGLETATLSQQIHVDNTP